MQDAGVLVLALALAGCSMREAPTRRMESEAELQRQDELAYANSPDIQLPELRKRLMALGISAKEIKASKEENDVDIFLIDLPDEKFAHIDKASLATLELDSRYRFQLEDPRQIKEFASYSVAEDTARRKQRYWRELIVNGEMGKFPRYRPGMSMSTYAPELERYCGYERGEALSVIDGRWLQYRNRMVDSAVERQRDGEPGLASFKCIVRIVYATGLQSHFVGNRRRPGATNS